MNFRMCTICELEPAKLGCRHCATCEVMRPYVVQYTSAMSKLDWVFWGLTAAVAGTVCGVVLAEILMEVIG